jgi:hypothetical protein
MRIRIIAATFAVVLLAALSPSAEPAATAKLVAPYLDDQAFAIAHVDLASLDVDAAVERFAKLAGVNVQQLADPRRAVREAVAAFRKAGANELYAVLSVADLPNPGPFVLVPRAGTNDDELKAALLVVGNETVEPLDGVMFAGSKKALDRLRGLKPAARPDLGAALEAVAGSPVQIVLVPSDEQRRIVAELMPALPKEVGGGPGTLLSKGVRWAALGVDTKPKLAIKLVIKSDDAAAVAGLAQAANHGLDTVSRDQAARRMFPKLDDMVAAVRPKVEGDRLTIAVDESNPGFAAEAATMVAKARSSAGRQQSMNNLKQMALAFHNYADVNKGTLPAAIVSKDGKPLLSWRVAILPYLDQNELYKQFKLDEPWDSEHNKKLIEKMPAMFHAPAQKIGDWKTTYLATTGMVDKAHIGVLGIKFQEITDGTSNTIMLVECNDDAAVVWTKPDDLTVDPKNPLKGILGHYEQGFAAAFADGSVTFISRTVDPKNLLGLFTRDGGEVVNR